MNEKQICKTKKNFNNKVLVTIIVLLSLIALLSSIIFMVNHTDNSNTKISLSNNNNICITITDDMLKKSINEYKDFGDLNIKDSHFYGLKEVTVQKTGEVFY